MLKLRLISMFFGLAVLVSCSKDDDSNPNPPGGGDPYMTLNAGDTRDFRRTVNNPTTPSENYQVTTTNRDTTVGSRVYRVFESSGGGNQYFNISGSDYYTYADVGGALQG